MGRAQETRRPVRLSGPLCSLSSLSDVMRRLDGVFSGQYLGARELLHLPPFRRCRRASPPRHRRARRVLVMAWWARGGVAGCTRRPRRAFFADSTTSPNRPAPPRECSFGRSPPTRRPCAILVGPSPCLSRMAPTPTTRLSLRVRSVVFTPQRWSSVFFLTLLMAPRSRDLRTRSQAGISYLFLPLS